jgi:DNA-directed RNA polymerase specialized sigma24 family protein
VIAKQRPLTPDQADLAGRYVPLAKRLARPFWMGKPGSRRHDAESAAMTRLVEIAGQARYRHEGGYVALARLAVPNAIRDELRRMRTTLDKRVKYGCIRTTPHPKPRPVPPDRSPDWNDYLDTCLARLGGLHKKVFALVWRDGLTVSEASRAVGMTHRHIWFVYQEALQILRGSPPRTQ